MSVDPAVWCTMARAAAAPHDAAAWNDMRAAFERAGLAFPSVRILVAAQYHAATPAPGWGRFVERDGRCDRAMCGRWIKRIRCRSGGGRRGVCRGCLKQVPLLAASVAAGSREAVAAFEWARDTGHALPIDIGSEP